MPTPMALWAPARAASPSGRWVLGVRASSTRGHAEELSASLTPDTPLVRTRRISLQTCSVDDDNAISCCDGLTCVYKSEYYAQCKSSGPSPANNPTHRPSPMPYPAPTKVPVPSPTKAPTKHGSTPSPTPKSGPTPTPGYSCGNPLSGKDSQVATWYQAWADKYVI